MVLSSCLLQLSFYVIGVAGWGTGLKLGSESKGVQYTGHRNIGIALFSIATFLHYKKNICVFQALESGVIMDNREVMEGKE
ncbi:hypothetical protein LguiB_016441 [Lonicera macranthoides]